MESRKRIYVLDSLRGIAAFIIAFIWHYKNFNVEGSYPLSNVLKPFYTYGNLMVEMFFMISGFVMSYCYKEKIMCAKINFNDYIIKRIKHLYPLHLITLLAVTIVQLIIKFNTGSTFGCGGFDLYHFLLNFFCIQVGWIDNVYTFNAPAWSISVEIFCYIVFYYILARGKNYLVYYGAGIIIGLSVLVMNWYYPIFNVPMGRGISCFLIGCILYELYLKFKEKQNKLCMYVCMYVRCF